MSDSKHTVLVIDAGNTSTSIGVYRSGRILRTDRLPTDVRSVARMTGKLKRLAGNDGKYEAVQSVPIRYQADGVDISLPRSLFASRLAELTYRVVTAVKLDAEATSIILDALPDDGMAIATRVTR